LSTSIPQGIFGRSSQILADLWKICEDRDGSQSQTGEICGKSGLVKQKPTALAVVIAAAAATVMM